MQLTGTDKERVDQAIAFAKAHRTQEYDHEKFMGLYQKAGVPYTEAAEKFCREWCGVLEDLEFCHRDNVRVDFCFALMAEMTHNDEPPEERLAWEYTPAPNPKEDGCGYPDFAAAIRERYGADTVPVAEGGYYYPSMVFVRPDGKIVAFLPDNGLEGICVYDTLFDFLCYQLSGCRIERVEKILDRKLLQSADMVLKGEQLDERGYLERVLAVLEFAKAHGGFTNIRLFEEWKSMVTPPIDLSPLTDGDGRTDSETVSLLVKVLDGRVPGKIEYVAI